MLSNIKRNKLITLLDKRNANYKNDDYIKQIENEIIPALDKLITMCGGDVNSEGMRDTSYRVIKSWLEMTKGYQEDPDNYLKVQFNIDENEMINKVNDIVIIKDIELRSVCEHHVLPFLGKVYIGYIPKKRVVGLSKIPRLVNGYAKRFQLQERLGRELAKSIMKYLDASGVIVYINATHTCMCARGVEESCNSSTTTLTSLGVFKSDVSLEQQFLDDIKY